MNFEIFHKIQIRVLNKIALALLDALGSTTLGLDLMKDSHNDYNTELYILINALKTGVPKLNTLAVKVYES